MANPTLMACPECDLMHRMPALSHRGVALCGRCGAILRQGVRGSFDAPLALSLASLMFFALANASPLLVLRLHGSLQEASIPGCIQALVSLGWPWLAAILITTVVLAPAVYLGGVAYVLLQLRLGRPGPRTGRVFRVVQEFQAWAMAEVFILGILVAFVKLSDMAAAAPGFSVYALAGFIIASSAATAVLDPGAVWDALGDGT